MKYDKSKFKVDENNGFWKLSKYIGNEEKVIVPDGIKLIDYEAFYDKEKNFSIKEIVLPESVEVIWNSAFFALKSLEKINIPKNVKNIGSCAFFGCENLKKLDISENVESLGGYFYHCSNLEELRIPFATKYVGELVLEKDNINVIFHNDIQGISNTCIIPKDFFNEATIKALLKNPVYKIIDNFVVNTKNSTALLRVKFDSNEIKIPDGICNLSSVIFDEGIFYETNLDEDDKKEIKEKIKRIKKIYIPQSVKKINLAWFSWCEELEKVVYRGKRENLEIISSSTLTNLCKVSPLNLIEFEENEIDENLEKRRRRSLYPMIERLSLINSLIKNKTYPNIPTLLDKCRELHYQSPDLSISTINRDIKRLRDDFLAPLKFDREKGGYYYEEDFDFKNVL